MAGKRRVRPGPARFAAYAKEALDKIEEETGKRPTDYAIAVAITHYRDRRDGDEAAERSAYTSRDVGRVLNALRELPLDDDLMDAWCYVLGLNRARAYKEEGILPPEMDEGHLALVMDEPGVKGGWDVASLDKGEVRPWFDDRQARHARAQSRRKAGGDLHVLRKIPSSVRPGHTAHFQLPSAYRVLERPCRALPRRAG